jgi:sugar diacid utilization regulator
MTLALKCAKFYEDDIEIYFYKRQVIPSTAERMLASQETLRYKLLKVSSVTATKAMTD